MSKEKKVTLLHAKSFVGEILSDDEGWNRTKGECATGVQYVFYKAGKPLGKTLTWRKGKQVKGNNVSPGTAIASFRDGASRFKNDHAAVLIRETAQGLEVYDQYNNPLKAWGKRTLYFRNNKDYSNNGNLFYVVT